MKLHVKMHEKISFDQKKREVLFFFPFGVPLCALALQNASLGRQTTTKGTFEKMKWHVKGHEKTLFD